MIETEVPGGFPEFAVVFSLHTGAMPPCSHAASPLAGPPSSLLPPARRRPPEASPAPSLEFSPRSPFPSQITAKSDRRLIQFIRETGPKNHIYDVFQLTTHTTSRATGPSDRIHLQDDAPRENATPDSAAIVRSRRLCRVFPPEHDEKG